MNIAYNKLTSDEKSRTDIWYEPYHKTIRPIILNGKEVILR